MFAHEDFAPALDLRTERLMQERAIGAAKDNIRYEILCTNGYKIGYATWTLYDVLDCAINDGRLAELAQKLHMVTRSYDKERDLATRDLIDWLGACIEKHVPERIVEEEAKHVQEALCE